MKKKIAILGSTGSIGKNLLNIIDKNKNKFSIILLSANKNYKNLYKQAIKYKVKYLIITDNKSFDKIKRKLKYSNIKVFNNYNCIKNIFDKKIDYVMNSIVGLDGLLPTLNIVKFTKTIAIANKESLICGWNLIQKELKKHRTTFVPVDSEHYSIWQGMKNTKDEIEKIYLTASGGPFINLPLREFKKINVSKAINHPNWKMGKKISVDSSTMMNKVFEIIEAKNIFNLDYNQLSILIHPLSYVHGIIKFKKGLIKIIAHDTDMKIPIFNSIYNNNNKININTKDVDLEKLNKLSLKKIDVKKFPLVNILKLIPKKNSLFETVIVSANDELVNLFLNKKINYLDIHKILLKLLNDKKYFKYKRLLPKNINDILELNKFVRFKINSLSI